MFDLNWAELLIIGVVALIVIGPSDLPDMFRQLGRFTAKLRQMSREFSRAMEQAAKDTGVKEAADDLKTATSAKSLGLDKVREAADKFEKWDPMKGVKSPTMPARSLTPPPMPSTPAPKALVPDDRAEAADDLADHAEPAILPPTMPSATIHGPATQALYDKQALKARVMQEQSAKLKAIEDGTYIEAAVKPARKPAVKKPKVEAAEPAKPKRKKAADA